MLTTTNDQRLAHFLTNYSLAVKPGEKVLVEARGPRTLPLVRHIIAEIAAAKGKPIYRLDEESVQAAYVAAADEEILAIDREAQLHVMKNVDCYLGIRGGENPLDMSVVPSPRMAAYTRNIVSPVHFDQRVKHTRWCVLRYPSPAFAQAARMATGAFEDFYFRACLLDYAKMSLAMNPLADRMAKASNVHIKGPRDTDLRFSIKGIGSVKCDGRVNIPDGEVFTAPIRDSVNGILHYNAATIYEGKVFDGIRLVFENGKITKATCETGNEADLNAILDRDEGARYIGEFSIAFNPIIVEPMLDILFDEKIAGSFHFTPGNAYDETPNGNKSQVHWDMVCIQRPEKGGGEIRFDDELIRKDGRFIPADLQPLNPENLLA